MSEQKEMFEEIAEIPETNAAEVNSIKIAPEVVATIAGISTTEIDGVAGMCTASFAGGIAEILGGKKNPSKGIKVDINEKNTVIDLYIIVDYGIRIPELAWEIQENVKNNVETMTGLTVEKVNIHVDGVSFKKAEEAEKQAENIEEEDDEAPEEVIVEETELEEVPDDDEMQL